MSTRRHREAASLIALAATLAAPAPALALTTNARALGMGNAHTALASDADMATWNPALLGLRRPDMPVVAVILPSPNLGFGNNFLSFDSLLGALPDENGNSRTLSDQTMQSLLNGLGNNAWSLLEVDSGVRLVAVAIPPLRTSLHAQVDLDAQGLGLPKGIMELLLQGATSGRNITLDGLRGASATGLVSAGVSHAVPLPLFEDRESAIGVTLRYIQGMAYLTVPDASGSIFSVDSDGKLSADAGIRYMMTWAGGNTLFTTGSGVAADVGFASQWNANTTWGFTIGNLGFVKWNKLQDKTYTAKISPTNLGLGYEAGADGQETTTGDPKDPFKNAFQEGTGPQNGQSDIDGKYPPYARIGVTWKGGVGLPRIGTSPLNWNTPPIPVVFAADLQQGFGTGYGISMVPQLNLGLETRPLVPFLPLRMGFSYGSRTMATVGAGLDFRFFKLDLASGTMNGIFGGAKGAYYALTTQLAF